MHPHVTLPITTCEHKLQCISSCVHWHVFLIQYSSCDLMKLASKLANCLIIRRNETDTDTASTSDDCCVGGLGKYSHGSIGLSHQHWVEQVISAGSFGVHCTEAAEAYHKTCMRLTSQRVKHLRPNLTQKSMLNYLQRFNLFETLSRAQMPVRTVVRRKQPTTEVSLLLEDIGQYCYTHDPTI